MAPWVIRSIREEKLERSLVQLRVWTPEKRKEEVDKQMINSIKLLSDDDALKALKSLKKPKIFLN